MDKKYYYVYFTYTAKQYNGDITSGTGSIRLWTSDGTALNHSMRNMTEANKYISNFLISKRGYLDCNALIVNIIPLESGDV